MDNKPKLIIRMGSHAEKEYILKLGKKFDGIIIGANVVEATAGATASLLGQKLKLPYYIDPMTYVFGCDLEGIRSDQKRKKKIIRDYKRSYKSLASELGKLFSNALETKKRIYPENIPSSMVKTICDDVVNYQLNRIRQEFLKDEEYKNYADSIPNIAGVFSPYFYIPSNSEIDWKVFIALSSTTAKIINEIPVYSVLCADSELLTDGAFINKAIKEIPLTGVDGVWLWFSKFDEWDIREKYLKGFKDLVKGLSQKGLEVYNRHGGYFSLILNKIGMTGISHGIGYGEKKDVQQIEGPPNAPVVHYYLPDIHKRFGVLDIERCFDEMKIISPKDFYGHMCDCVICKGVIKDNIEEFKKFGEDRYATPESKRKFQTPAAAKRCRFHFLINRVREKEFISSKDLKTIVKQINDTQEKWKEQVIIARYSTHLARWEKALS
jgi:hypothetical protein